LIQKNPLTKPMKVLKPARKNPSGVIEEKPMTKIHYAREDNISILTLDDGKMNVMNWDFFRELNESLDRALGDQTFVTIFTGRPGVFSAGLDLKLLPTQSLEEQIRFQKLLPQPC